MAETKQINFDLHEVAIALIKKEGIREGRWMLGLEFTFGAGNLGAGPTDTKPGAFRSDQQAGAHSARRKRP